MVTIVTGKINSGKTTTLKKMYDKTKQGDGFIALKSMENEKVHHYDLLQLKLSKTMLFAVHERIFKNDFTVLYSLGPYKFNKAAFDWIETTTKTWIKDNISPIYFDEVGKLELNQLGYYPFIINCLNDNLDIIMSVREDLVDKVISCFNLKDSEYQLKAVKSYV